MNPYELVKSFEKEISSYAGSPYAVAVDSCTNALFLSCVYRKAKRVTLPARTYVSVPQSVIHAGGSVVFDDFKWDGSYRLAPYPIIDSACSLYPAMYETGMDICLSFSANKPLNIGKGGMILTNDSYAVEWYKRARYEGRSEKDLMQDSFDMLGWNMYMTPEQAARGLQLLSFYKPTVFSREYPDLRRFPIFSEKTLP